MQPASSNGRGDPGPILTGLFALCALSMVLGCGPRPYHIKYLAKGQIDLVADTHLTAINGLMKELMAKLYRRNPNQLAVNPAARIHQRVSLLFDRQPGNLAFDELGGKKGTEAMLLCFDDGFAGDRVFAVMAGLVGMVWKSYGDQTEFFINDSLDQQNLYNSARNIEILVWRLSNRHDPQGRPYLLTNGVEGPIQNLSFERLFGKMIAIQDMMARIMADRTNRLINKVAITAASSFLPVGF